VPGVKPYRCEECGRRFRQSVHLTAHLRTHSNDRPFRCAHCPDKAYKHRIDLRKHCSAVHGLSLPVTRRRRGGIDVVAEAVAAANIGPDDGSDF